MGGREGTGSSTTGSPSSTGGATSRDADRSTGTATGSSAGQAQSGMAQKLDKGLQESLEKLHAANQAELHMAQMGQQNAQSPQVKEFAQKLGEDHQKLDEKLTTAAQGAGAASLEGKAFQKERDKATKDMDKLQKKTGAEFDKAYMDMMVKDHEKDLKNVKDAAKDARKHNHTELASLLEGAQTGMQGHLDHAKQIRDSLGQAQRQGRTGTPGAERSGAAGTGSAGQSDRAGPTGASPQGAGGPGTGSGASGSGSNPSLPDRSSPQPGGSPSDRATK
jgi:putative membrane protein